MSLLTTLKNLDYTALEAAATTALELIVTLGTAAAPIEKLFDLSPADQSFITKLIALGNDAGILLDEATGITSPSETMPTEPTDSP